MTQDELMNQLTINNDIDGLTTQEYAEAIGKPFLRIRAILMEGNNRLFRIIPKQAILSDYMLLDTWTPILDEVDGLSLSGVSIEVLPITYGYDCEYKIENNKLYITLTGPEKGAFESDIGNIGVDITILLYTNSGGGAEE